MRNTQAIILPLVFVGLAATTAELYAQTKRPGRTTYAPITLSATDAKDHVGETATVCGTVASTRHLAASRGSPTFLNLDKPYPNHEFTVVIWGANRANFGEPEKDFKDKEICVTGTIETYRGKPQIVAKAAKDIVLKGKKTTQN